jgi:hypothetical protein
MWVFIASTSIFQLMSVAAPGGQTSFVPARISAGILCVIFYLVAKDAIRYLAKLKNIQTREERASLLSDPQVYS